MNDEQKPDLSLLKPVTRSQRLKLVASLENNPTLSYRDWMNKRTASQTARGSSSGKVQIQPSVVLPSSSPMLIKDEPWQGPTELSLSRALTLAAEDWIGPSKDSSYKTQTHPPSDEVKLMLTYSSGNPNLNNKAPPLRPTPQPDLLQLPNICPNLVQGLKHVSNASIPKRSRLRQLPNICPNLVQGLKHVSNASIPKRSRLRQLPNICPNLVQGLKHVSNASIPKRSRSGLKRKAQPVPTPSQSTRNGSMIKKPAENLLCHLCQATCSSALTLQQHLKGRPHKAKMVYMKMKRESTTTQGRQGAPRCDVCQIWCSDLAALEMHFKGQKHMSNVQELQLCRQRGGQKLSKAPILCELCHVPCMNEDLYQMHLKGRQHATNVELKRRGFC